MLQFDIDVKTGIRLREVTLNDAPMIYRAIADHRDYLKTWLPFVINLSEQDEMDFRSVRTLCRWAVEARLMHRIQIRCAVENYSSNAIPRRLGFRLEGTERDGELMFSGEYVDTNVYSILDSEIISWSGKNI